MVLPLADLSWVLADPLFADSTLVAVRATETVDIHGRAVATSVQELAFSGVVVPLTADMLERLPEGERINGKFVVHTTFRLRAGNNTVGVTADVVRWNGLEGTVVRVDDWSTYGTGFVSATCS